MAKVEEYKDKRGDNRIRVTADNGRVIYGSTEGYRNRGDMRATAINAAIEILNIYLHEASAEQSARVAKLGKVADVQ